MSSNSGGQGTPGTLPGIPGTNLGTPRTKPGTTGTIPGTPGIRDADVPTPGKRKRNELTPEKCNEIQKIEEQQLKLKSLLEKTINEVDGLFSTLGVKTKTETRGHAEKLQLIMETIKENNLLDSLGYALESQVTENQAEHGQDMDLDETRSTIEEMICSRCRKEITDEKQVAENMRAFVQEFHITECQEMSEKDLVTFNKKWPEGAYVKATLKTGNPLQEAEGDVLLALKTKDDNPYIRNKLEERHVGLKDIIKDELVDGQIQFLENTTKTKSGVQKSGRVYVMSGETLQAQFNALKELEAEAKGETTKKISIIAADENVRTNIRKLIEIVFFQTNLEIDIFVPRKENKGKAHENKYDTIVVNTSADGKTYSDMLKIVRENINPENLGITIKSLRKRKDDSLLIVTEKSTVETLKKEFTDNENMKDIHIVEKKCDLLITGMDAVTTQEELLKALEVAGSLTEDDKKTLVIKSMYTNRSGEQVATVTTTQKVGDKVLPVEHLKIGWSRCRVKEKFSIPRCSNCLRIGHINKNCKTRKTEGKKCLNCTQPNHEAKDCQNKSHCNSCAKEGHRADSMSCPKYRKKVFEKERSLIS